MSWVIGPMLTMARDSVLDLHLVEFVEDRPAEFGAERQHQHGGLFVALERALVGVGADDELAAERCYSWSGLGYECH